jgi:hypothetical protein
MGIMRMKMDIKKMDIKGGKKKGIMEMEKKKLILIS